MTKYFNDELIWGAEAPDRDNFCERLIKYRLEWCPSDGQYWFTVYDIGKRRSVYYYPLSKSSAHDLQVSMMQHREDLHRREDEKAAEKQERGLAEQALMGSIVKGYICKKKEEYEDE